MWSNGIHQFKIYYHQAEPSLAANWWPGRCGQNGIFLTRSLCGTLMDSPVHVIVSAHTWPATSTDVKDPSKLCVREPHVPSQRPLMEPVKTASRARAASLILSPNYCWGRITPRIAMGVLLQADTQKGTMSLFFCFVSGSWSQHWQLCLLISGFTNANTYGPYHFTKKNPSSMFFLQPGYPSVGWK